MKNHLNNILEDLYMLDPSLKNREKDLKKLIQKLIEAKPNLIIDDTFLSGLRRQLSAKADELMESGTVRSGGFIRGLQRMVFPFAGGVLAAALVVVVVLSINDQFKSYVVPVEVVAEKAVESDDGAEIAIEDYDVVPPMEKLPKVTELKVGMGGGLEPLSEPGDPRPEDIKVFDLPEADTARVADVDDTALMEEPVMMMAMPAFDKEDLSELELIQQEMDEFSIMIEKWMTENAEDLSEEQVNRLAEMLKAASALFTDSLTDINLLRETIDNLKLELEKLRTDKE